ncbi:hypothetical protein DXG01_010121 [Tephrocybe rancida]|nr:hypothetical protein DXG01_010121 [Tephrocybe rancida]
MEKPPGSSNDYEPSIAKASPRSNYGTVAVVDPGQDAEPPQADDEQESAPNSKLHRGLSARQVQMIAIAGTIGTGLFLGTGRSLAKGGPASILICYCLVGFVVYITLLLLGEMATQYPVAGSFNAYATRFFSPSYGFALSWNYWFNDAVSVASDLTAAQILLEYWTPWHPWVISLVFWVFLVSVNAIHVRAYGELEYWLSSLKVVTIIIFIILGIIVNAGVNPEHRYIGGSNWRIPGAPFVGGFGGFASVFVTASFAYWQSVERKVWVSPLVRRETLRGICQESSSLSFGVPWDYPNLSNKTTTTSPFTIIFQDAGSKIAASFMNSVIMTSVLSAGNHALFAGTRVLYGLSVARQAPKVFSHTTKQGIPIYSLLLTSSVSILCFGSSFIGSGQLWGWLQNIVGVSNQIAWVSIGLASWRFRTAWVKQGRSLDELKFRAGWTWPWGPPFVVVTVTFMIIVQGWSSVIPTFSAVDFVSFYIEIPVMIVMFIAWMVVTGARSRRTKNVQQVPGTDHVDSNTPRRRVWYSDFVDAGTVDLYRDEYIEVEDDKVDDEQRTSRIIGKAGYLWKVYYWIA